MQSNICYALILCLAIISGCKPSLSDLVGSKWTLQRITTSHGQQLIPQNYYVFEVAEEQLHLQLDVNRCSMPWKMEGTDGISIEDKALCTRACCDSEIAKALVKKLVGSHRVQFTKDQLILSGRDSIVFRPWEEGDVKQTDEKGYLKIRRTGCFGPCPIYEMTIYEDGLAQFFGRRFVQHEGEAKKQLNTTVVRSLFEQAESIGFSSLAPVYDNPQISDMETIYIDYNRTEIKVRLRMDAPDSLLELIDDVHDQAVEAGWVKGQLEK